MREASSGENSTSSHKLRANFTPSTAVRMISSFAMLSLYSRWMALVARKTWMRGRAASLSAFQACVDVLAIAAGQAGDGRAVHFAGDRIHRLPIAARGDREAGFDDVDAELGERLRDAQLFRLRHAAARRLLAVAQRRVEDQHTIRIGRTYRHLFGRFMRRRRALRPHRTTRYRK